MRHSAAAESESRTPTARGLHAEGHWSVTRPLSRAEVGRDSDRHLQGVGRQRLSTVRRDSSSGRRQPPALERGSAGRGAERRWRRGELELGRGVREAGHLAPSRWWGRRRRQPVQLVRAVGAPRRHARSNRRDHLQGQLAQEGSADGLRADPERRERAGRLHSARVGLRRSGRLVEAQVPPERVAAALRPVTALVALALVTARPSPALRAPRRRGRRSCGTRPRPRTAPASRSASG